VRSRGGVFEVTVGNELIFSKKQLGRFPAPGEVEEKLSARTAEA
jgi:selenoprotein W-related protein